uniref:Calmodulin n=1 Tax=Eutreptiella gymnastica TaxID=73025 RepID=A0A7S1J3Q8_9EUGL|mmetsp:Transcript_63591/g.113528  ORF Transcript_63591/g.113528 Transcript_63591/m.113528 type:complete len:1033 (+) Transcript_63591:104-3202(+)
MNLIAKLKEKFGKKDGESRVDFIAASPTGPAHIPNGFFASGGQTPLSWAPRSARGANTMSPRPNGAMVWGLNSMSPRSMSPKGITPAWHDDPAPGMTMTSSGLGYPNSPPNYGPDTLLAGSHQESPQRSTFRSTVTMSGATMTMRSNAQKKESKGFFGFGKNKEIWASSKNDLEALFRITFTIIESLWMQLDPEASGTVWMSQLQHIFGHKNMKEANEIKTWFNVPLDVPDDKIMFYEFLGLMFFWQARVGDWTGVLLEALAVQTLANGLNAIITCYRHYDFDGNKSLKMIEVQHFLHDKLPEIHKMNWEPTTKQFFGGRRHIRYPQFMGLIYVITQGTEFIKRSPGKVYRYTESMFLSHLREAFKVLENDFMERDGGKGYLTLEEFVSPTEHRLVWAEKPEEERIHWITIQRCDGCSGLSPVWGCPYPRCRFCVCHTCWEAGLKSHGVPAGGVGTKHHTESVVEMTRQVFSRVDYNESGNVDFFEFLTVVFLMIRFGYNYNDVHHVAEDPLKVEKALTAIGRAIEEFDTNRSGTLDLEEISMFCRKFVPSLPVDVRVPKFDNLKDWYDQLCLERGKLQLAGFIQFLYFMVMPDGKWSPERNQSKQSRPTLQTSNASPRATVRREVPDTTEVTVRKPVLMIMEQDACHDPEAPTPRAFKKMKTEGLQLKSRWSEVGQVQIWKANYDGHEVLVQKCLPSMSRDAHSRVMHSLIIQQRARSRRIQAVLSPVEDITVLEYCGGGSIYTLYSKYSPKSLKRETCISRSLMWQLALEVAEAMRDLNRHNIIHRNLCGQNVLLTTNLHAKVSNFDVATDEAMCNHVVGVPGYMAPELMQGLNYDHKCDVYSYGSLLYEITHCCAPFARDPRKTQEEHFEIVSTKVLAGTRPTIDPILCPHKLAQLIKDCWITRPTVRPTFAEIIHRLEEMRSDFEQPTTDVNVMPSYDPVDEIAGSDEDTGITDLTSQSRPQSQGPVIPDDELTLIKKESIPVTAVDSGLDILGDMNYLNDDLDHIEEVDNYRGTQNSILRHIDVTQD